MKLVIKQIGEKELHQFLKFKIDLYKDNQFAIPPLYMDEMQVLSKVNPAFDFCRSIYFMAYENGIPVGRIAGIINERANAIWQKPVVRFGYLDFINNKEISQALIEKVSEWGKSQGMTEIQGPLGFTDLDKEGLLIEGFDQIGTMVTDYTFPYYPEHLEAIGFKKEADWVEFKIMVPSAVPERMSKIANIVAQKSNLRAIRLSSIRQIVKQGWAHKIFNLINESYAPLYGFSPLTPRQIDYYVNIYISMINPEYISLIADQNEKLVGLGIMMPNLSKALQKANGSLFPFGWYHLLKALKGKNDIVDLLLVAVEPEFQGKGVNAMVFNDLIPRLIKNGVRYAESNPELDDNTKVQSQWELFDHTQHKRRRAYKKLI